MENVKRFEVKSIGAIVIFTNEEMKLLSVVWVWGVRIVFGLTLPKLFCIFIGVKLILMAAAL